jgi:hypothetical protein
MNIDEKNIRVQLKPKKSNFFGLYVWIYYSGLVWWDEDNY